MNSKPWGQIVGLLIFAGAAGMVATHLFDKAYLMVKGGK